MHPIERVLRALTHLNLGAALALAAAAAHASCGAAFCTLMTDRYAEGTAAHPGWSADLRLEAVTQKQLRRGTRDLSGAEGVGEEGIERHTKNLNLLASLTYTTESDWSFTVRLPLVRRDHLHDLVDEDTGALGPSERWRFTEPGDVQLLARRAFAGADGATAWAVFGGLKLPTGKTGVKNADGDAAERALQPGSGTTDLVLGVAWRRAIGPTDAVVGQASIGQAIASTRDYEPGRRLEASVGWSHAFSPTFGSVVQLNARRRARDSGTDAEPEVSRSTTVDLSPGLTFGVGHAATVYAYLQLPVYQKVNGIQLVPKRAFAIGWTSDF